jgi:membrane-associated phospholipid phosphatase
VEPLHLEPATSATTRRSLLTGAAGALICATLPAPSWATGDQKSGQILAQWYKLLLELIRHTATYSPPVASRAFAYLGITAFEAVASGSPVLRSLAGQVAGLTPLPDQTGGHLDAACVLHAALSHAIRAHFGNTGPTGQRAMAAMSAGLADLAAENLPRDVVARSAAYGEAISQHIEAWSASDGGAEVINLGFPEAYSLTQGPAYWVPTSTTALQQTPLLPAWGQNRPFTLPPDDLCALPAPTPYSEDPTSAFYAEAMEVYEISKSLTPEQETIARFWSDDPMLSPTPPGHWVAIALQIFERDATPLTLQVETLALLGMGISDAFIACWRSKYIHNLLRPVTYIRRVIDPAWQPLLITPPFPEYPSGHSTQTGAAAGVLAGLYGTSFSFEDATHVDDGLPARRFPSFQAAAEEAAISRIYGGIHFRPAVDLGLVQGACVAAHVLKVITRA